MTPTSPRTYIVQVYTFSEDEHLIRITFPGNDPPFVEYSGAHIPSLTRIGREIMEDMEREKA